MAAGERSESSCARCTQPGIVPRVTVGRVARVPIAGRRVPATRSGPVPWRATLRGRCGCSREFRHEQPDPARFYTALAEDSVAQLAQLRRPRRAPSLLDVGGGPGYFRDAFRGRGRDLLRPRRRRRRALRPRRDRAPGTVIGSGMAAAVPRRRRRRLLLLQRPRARAATRGGWPRRWCGSPGPAARSSSATRCGSGRGAGTRPRRGTSSAAAAPGAATRASTATSPRTGTASRCSPSRCATGCAGPARSTGAEVVATSARATTRGGRWWLLRVPVVREVVTWNLVHRAAQAVSADLERAQHPVPDPARSPPALLLVGLAFVQAPGLARRRHQVRPGRRPRPTSSPARCTCGTPRAPSASCRTRPTATCGRWARSSCSGDLLGLPGWVVQRLWLALVLSVAFVGRRQAGARARRPLRPGLPGRRVRLRALAADAHHAGPDLDRGLARARWPRGCCCRSSSARRAARRAAPRRCPALAVAMVGGVNAAATFAVLPLGVLWLLTRDAGPAPPGDDAVVAALHALATLWWLVPLFVLGAYSPPFLDYIETAAVTTFPTDPLRRPARHLGLGALRRPGSRAGNDLIATSAPRAQQRAVLLLLGLAGLLDRRTPHRRFLGLASSWACADGHRRATPAPSQGWCAGACGPARRRARAAAQRAQVRPGAAPAAGARPGLRPRPGARRPPRGRRPPATRRRPRGPGRTPRASNRAALVGMALVVSSRPPCPPSLGGSSRPAAASACRGYWAQAAALARRALRQRRRPAGARARRSPTTSGEHRATSPCSGWPARAGRCATSSRWSRRATCGCSTRSRSASPRGGARPG